MKKLFAVLATIISLTVLLTCTAVSASSEEISPDGYLVGDIDMDSEISIKDATLAQMYVSKFINFNETQLILGDCDDKAGVQISDATWIQMYVSKMGGEYPTNLNGYKIGEIVNLNFSTLVDGKTFNEALKQYDKSTKIKAIVFDDAAKYSHI